MPFAGLVAPNVLNWILESHRPFPSAANQRGRMVGVAERGRSLRVVRTGERGRVPRVEASFVVGGEEVSQREGCGGNGRGRCGAGEKSAQGGAGKWASVAVTGRRVGEGAGSRGGLGSVG